jgi:two-component system LytT family response regulator
MTLRSFKGPEEFLSPNKFIRVHNSYIVSFDKIESVERHRMRIGNKIIPLRDSRKETFNERLKAKCP